MTVNDRDVERLHEKLDQGGVPPSALKARPHCTLCHFSLGRLA
jgi:hypothetical protein